MRTVVLLLLLANITLFAVHEARQRRRRRGRAAARAGAARQDHAPHAAAGGGARPGEGRVAGRRVRRVGPVLRRRAHARAGRPRAAAARPPADAAARGLRRRVVGQPRARSRTAPPPTSARGELRQQGVDDVSVVDAGRGQFAVSLGAVPHRGRPRARAPTRSRAEPAQRRKSSRAAQPSAQTMLVVRDPQQAGGRAPARSCSGSIRAATSRSASCHGDADPRRRGSRGDIDARPRAVSRVRGGPRRVAVLPGLRRASSRRCPASTRRRAAACCSPASTARRAAASRCARCRRRDATPTSCELKRLYVRRRRARHAASAGALARRSRSTMRAPPATRSVKLDTLAHMDAARALYAEPGLRAVPGVLRQPARRHAVHGARSVRSRIAVTRAAP